MQYGRKTKYTNIPNTNESRHSENGFSETKANSLNYAYDYERLQYKIQHRTVLIHLPLDDHHSSDVVYRKRSSYMDRRWKKSGLESLFHHSISIVLDVHITGVLLNPTTRRVVNCCIANTQRLSVANTLLAGHKNIRG